MALFSPFSPIDIRILPPPEGKEAIRQMLADQKEQLLIITTPGLCARLSLTSFFTALQGDGHCLHLMTDVSPNPSVENVCSVIQGLRQQSYHPSCILAIGGGSCLDMAKAISALWYLPNAQTVHPEKLRQVIQAKTYTQSPHFLPWLAMPTTSGTGSEVTPWATIWDTNQKLSIDCLGLFAKAAVLIPDWALTMPAELTLATGLDALSHAMEAFWARARSPLSQALALTSIKTIQTTLPKVLQNSSNLYFRREMCTASLLAGLAFSITRTTACHSISYPLTMLWGVPHGFAVALTLAEVMERNSEAVPEIADIQALFSKNGSFRSWLDSITDNIARLRLSAFAIDSSNIPMISELAFTHGRMDNNPVPFAREDVIEILRQCL